MAAGLGPPAVEHGEVEGAVQGRLHARGAAGLERAARVVEPDVHAACQAPPEGHVVVGDEDDGAGVAARHRDQGGDQPPALAVVGVRLAGEHELEAAREQRLDARRIGEDQVGALVAGGAAREAERQHVGVEVHAGTLGDHGEQLALERVVRRPPAVGRAAGLVDARVLPGRHVHAVGDGEDLARALDVAPHGARDLAVELRDRIGAAGEAEPGDGHVEGIAPDDAHLRLA